MGFDVLRLAYFIYIRAKILTEKKIYLLNNPTGFNNNINYKIYKSAESPKINTKPNLRDKTAHIKVLYDYISKLSMEQGELTNSYKKIKIY